MAYNSVDAPHNCPGPESQLAGQSTPCAGCPNQGACSSGAAAESAAREREIANEVKERLSNIRKFILVMSGKGGVGKSTVASLLARTFAAKQLQTGVVDIDLCGPSIATMMGAEGERVRSAAVGWQPVAVAPNLVCASSAFLMGSLHDALVWRGPRKNGLITQLLRDVDWGELDVLVIDTPPGTSDEHLAILNFLPIERTAALLVTTPQQVALSAVQKQMQFCKRLGVPIMGIVENMTSYICSCCGHSVPIFPSGKNGKEAINFVSEEYNIPILAKIPVDQSVGAYCDNGRCPDWLMFEDNNFESSHPIASSFLKLAESATTFK